MKILFQDSIKSSLKRNLINLGFHYDFKPTVGQMKFGDFKRLTPISDVFGYDRGGPIDRYYIENFLTNNAECIQGRCLEIGDNEYTMRFGGDKVLRSDILHVHERNPQATIIGDISDLPQVEDDSFDCIILTQTLHLIYDFKKALQSTIRILKPGGFLLLTVPGITPIAKDEWGESWYWSFTSRAMQKIMEEVCPQGKTEVENFGNVFSASSFLYGLGWQELTHEQLDYQDPDFQVVVTVKVQKL
ncbi:methyltransferase domain-containing protein [Litoribacter ruber]|uniref:class I SAM-dependent methyltransferase n=1 Tax=Litoribacter ruber TaxID=702568 RepID=UPI001BD935E4|nr:class I SAM-dependent methyltransferase [Litoribacter ruber]MBT0811445.1 methyltransferase domain-containing protein [Litoribacter ruber]